MLNFVFLRPKKSHRCAEPRDLTYFTSMSVVASWLWAELIPRLHDTTGCQTGSNLYNRFDNLWQPAVSCKQTSNRLDVCLHDAGCQTGLYLYNRFDKPVQPVWQTGCTKSHCSFNRLSNRVVQPVWQPAAYTIQPVVKLVVKRVWQRLKQRVECLYTRYNRLSNRFYKWFYNRFDNNLYRVNGALEPQK